MVDVSKDKGRGKQARTDKELSGAVSVDVIRSFGNNSVHSKQTSGKTKRVSMNHTTKTQAGKEFKEGKEQWLKRTMRLRKGVRRCTSVGLSIHVPAPLLASSLLLMADDRFKD